MIAKGDFQRMNYESDTSIPKIVLYLELLFLNTGFLLEPQEDALARTGLSWQSLILGGEHARLP